MLAPHLRILLKSVDMQDVQVRFDDYMWAYATFWWVLSLQDRSRLILDNLVEVQKSLNTPSHST